MKNAARCTQSKKKLRPEIGDIWYNDTYGFHVLILEQNVGGWREVHVLELNEGNWYRDDDFQDDYWEWLA